ncbi:MAG: DNA polymerase IV [Pirellulaceae bacterium]|nr:DNA polymerase IV [Pirellulaceae bacterium]
MILHVDMDAFYAAVEERENPELRGKPVIVGGKPEHRGVVSTANYEARRYGVHSAMPTAAAKRLCPHGVFLTGRIGLYAEVSEQICEVFERYTPLIEPLSLDEAFLDVTGSERLFGSPVEIGRRIQAEIKEELELVASVGVAPNKFLAKIASDLEKPNGFVVVDGSAVLEFLDPLEVGRLWGVGKVTGEAFRRLGVKTIGDVRRLPDGALQQFFGEHGEHLSRLARGLDIRRVVPHRQARSISHETTFPTDIADVNVLRAWVITLAEQVAWRLRRYELRTRGVQLKLRYSNFQTITRSLKLKKPTNVTQILCEAACELLLDRVDLEGRSVRLVGVGAQQLDGRSVRQKNLFEDEENLRLEELDKASDQIRQRFGSGSLGRASAWERKKERKKKD